MVRWGELQSIPPRPKLWGDADVLEVGQEGAEPSSPEQGAANFKSPFPATLLPKIP